jgi:hypothetical protein
MPAPHVCWLHWVKMCVQGPHVSWLHLVLHVLTRHVPQCVAQVPQFVAQVPQLVAHVPHWVAHVAQVPHLVTHVNAFVMRQFAPQVLPTCVGMHGHVSIVHCSVQLQKVLAPVWQRAVNGGMVSHSAPQPVSGIV